MKYNEIQLYIYNCAMRCARYIPWSSSRVATMHGFSRGCNSTLCAMRCARYSRSKRHSTFFSLFASSRLHVGQSRVAFIKRATATQVIR